MILLFPGSFDPPTSGHADIIERAAKICDKLYIGILVNVNKKYKYSLEQRIEMLKRIAGAYDNTEVISFDGLVVKAAEKVGADAIVKGLRNSKDYIYESDMAQINRKISGIETLYLQADPEKALISSSIVRELMLFGYKTDELVPESIRDLL